MVKRSQLVPGAAQKPIEGVLGKCFPKGTGFLLHVHAAVSKDITELIFEDGKHRNALLFPGITFPYTSVTMEVWE